ncbi:WD40 repeat domain-containing protein [Solirubrobacter soli]|uniref:WD40 repeat domain-containing protein n=1 Tax=Solirubrobacter soli TaxID=363832 RepID=UPI0004186F1A|nr:PD40 domain-containing protein [Solirubrobacter soli]
MKAEELERALRELEPPDAGPARERARRTVLAAHHQARSRRRFRRLSPLVYVAIAVVLATLVVTQRDSGPVQAFERRVREIVNEPKPTPTPPAPLPAGRLLVSDANGLTVFSGARRIRLGGYDDATWSPHGLFVGATDGRALVALNPANGALRWRLVPGGTVSVPRWAPDGLHVAYRAGGALRIVYGNGRHDVLAGKDMAPVAPAWRPTTPRTVAWANANGTVTVEDADTAKVLRSYRSAAVRHLAWSHDGRKLLIAGRRNGTIHDYVTGARTPVKLDGDLLAAAYGPPGLALAVRHGDRTEIRLRGSVLFSAGGRLDDLEWSPDGRWLLAGDAAGGQWLLARAAGQASVSSVRRLGASARTHGWCC